MIDRHLLRYFLAVVDRGGFSRGAEALHVTQPTLSAGIAKLERLAGASLFDRSHRRVQLTPAGSRLLAHARAIEAEFARADQAVRGAAMPDRLRLAMLSTIATPMMARIVSACAAAGFSVELVEGGGERDLAARLDGGRVDIAIGLERPGQARFKPVPLLEEGYALALAMDHPLAREPSIAAEQLAEDAMIIRRQCEALGETSRFFVARGVRPFLAARTTDDDRALALVAVGLGVTAMPAGHSAPGVVRPLLEGFGARRTIALLTAPDALVRPDQPLIDGIGAAVRGQ